MIMDGTASRNTIWDPLRKKEVALTPEEHVRQWFIGQLHGRMQVPLHMMMSETSFKLGSKVFRADILIYGRSARPLAVVECKRPETELDRKVLDQTIRYNMVLDVSYIIITNGNRTIICRKTGGSGTDTETAPTTAGYEFLDHAPTYGEMLREDALPDGK